VGQQPTQRLRAVHFSSPETTPREVPSRGPRGKFSRPDRPPGVPAESFLRDPSGPDRVPARPPKRACFTAESSPCESRPKLHQGGVPAGKLPTQRGSTRCIFLARNFSSRGPFSRPDRPPGARAESFLRDPAGTVRVPPRPPKRACFTAESTPRKSRPKLHQRDPAGKLSTQRIRAARFPRPKLLLSRPVFVS
jgi:hypothetical protein